MAFEIYSTEELLGVLYDENLASKSDFWLRNFYPGVHQSTRQGIVMEKIEARREIAAFVRPTSVGRPTYKRMGSKLDIFTPAYIKPKDAVRPVDQLARPPGQLFSPVPPTPDENYDAEVGNILRDHREKIERRWELMAARALIDGEVTIAYEDGPAVTVDFDRAANHTVIKDSAYWTTSYDILGDIQAWCDRIAQSPFGGMADTLIVAPDVWQILRTNTVLKDLMDLTFKRSDVDLARGLLLAGSRDSKVRRAGRIDGGGVGGLEVYVYNDFYINDEGAAVPILAPKEIVLLDSNFEGIKAFGAILDKKANLSPLPMFPKMWDEEDPPATNIMTQSAPLMIPAYPNRVLRARVLAP